MTWTDTVWSTVKVGDLVLSAVDGQAWTVRSRYPVTEVVRNGRSHTFSPAGNLPVRLSRPQATPEDAAIGVLRQFFAVEIL